jgi:ribosomal protein S12 methylthiotransferase
MRKKHISKSIEDLVIETEGLVRRGAKEIILIAQELTYYGLDLYKKRALPDLLNRLADIEGLKWLRLHYAYPSKFPREIIEVMRSRDNICNYLDIPLQHASNAVLENMRRHTSMEEMQDLLDYCRQMIPDIKIRTTMLVGHPGETEEDIAILKTFIQKNEFDRLGVFQYSHEEGTRAYEMTDDVPAEEKARRANEIMEIQQMISLRKNREIIGKELEVMIDRQEGDHWYGRTYGDSPEVDNEVIIHTSIKLRIGQFVKVDVVDALEYDLIAEY